MWVNSSLWAIWWAMLPGWLFFIILVLDSKRIEEMTRTFAFGLLSVMV